ncbi:AMP-binding protein [Arenibacter echinorum]|uniref:O-succinylbenzoic acid--CoA ligase n=1 Tax=Arenibacter echinorum TaxID=440515 RepID=A0A327RAE7_9FLAO|nr:AMP-binding protein [Arenibacter echinorum]RAJ12453.1 O-succinylbenzoic acid--CoA ligase [Arenibacter echinorum]
MSPSYKNIHPKFKFNEIHYDFGDLKELAYSLVKEGQEYEKSIGNFLMDWLDDSDSLKVHTSGSTGVPKTITLKKEHMINSALATGAFFKMGPGTKALQCLSANHIAGRMMLVRAVVLGWEIDTVEPTSNPLQFTSKHYDFVAMVPMQVQGSLSNLYQICTLIIGGAPISPELKSDLNKVETRIFETYGMTETITHIAVKELTKGAVNNNFKALPEVVFTNDERDCLVIEAPKVSDGIITTNDVVNLISTSEFQWLGRYDNVINSGGVKIIPELLENKLSSLIKSRFFVAGIPDAYLGQKLILVVEGKVDVNQLFHDIKSLSSISKFKIPKAIFSVDHFVETVSGKVNRNETLGIIK